MKRIVMVVLMSCLLFLQGGRPSFAQKVAKQDKPPQKQLEREKLQDGVEVWRLWLTKTGPKETQIAILLLSDKKHSLLLSDAKTFINDHKIFPQDTISVRGLGILRLSHALGKNAAGADPDNGLWVTTCMHDPMTSNSGCQSMMFE